MKLLLFYSTEFWFKTHAKVLPEAPDDIREGCIENAVVVFLHAEPADERDLGGVETKLVKNVKWLAGKFQSKAAALHYFSHLGDEMAAPELAHRLVEGARRRLTAAGVRVEVTPFGHFCQWRLAVAGDSLAKVFKQF